MFGKASHLATLGEQRLTWMVCHFKDKELELYLVSNALKRMFQMMDSATNCGSYLQNSEV